MRLSLPLRYIAPSPVPPRPTLPQVYTYLNQKVADLKLELDDQVQSVNFLIRTFQNDRSVKARHENRFLSPRKINPSRPFPLNQLVYRNPNVQFEFENRNSQHPDRVEQESLSEEDALILASKRGGAVAQAVEELRTEAEALVNQEEFVDVYFYDNPTPLRLNITDLSATQTISLLTSVVPPPTTSTTSSSSQNISTTSPSEPSTTIPLGQGKELWEHVWKSRNLDTDKTKYLWRGGERVRVKSKDELLAEGKAVRGPGQPGAKRKWTNGRFTMGERKEGEGEGEEEEPRVV